MMLRKISLVAAVAVVLAMPAVAIARGGGGGGAHMGGGGGGGAHWGGGGGGAHWGGGGGGARWGGGGMHAMHMGGPSFGSVGRVQSFRSPGVFQGRHAFFAGRHFDHFHHFRHGRFFVGGLGFYDYGYNSCYRPVLTPWGWRYTWVCSDYGYGDYDY